MKKQIVLGLTTLLFFTACVSDIEVDVVDTRAQCGNGLLRIVGTGPVITETLELSSFRKVTNLQGVNVRISQGDEQIVTATGHANVISRLERAVSGEGWTIALKEGCYSAFVLSLHITVPDLEEVVSKSSGDILLEGFDGLDRLEITSWGSGDITAVSSFSTLEELNVDSRGSGNLSLFAIPAESCTVYSAGSGDTAVQVQNSLDVTIKGSGDVSYQGTPVVTQELIGSGRVINDN